MIEKRFMITSWKERNEIGEKYMDTSIFIFKILFKKENNVLKQLWNNANICLIYLLMY